MFTLNESYTIPLSIQNFEYPQLIFFSHHPPQYQSSPYFIIIFLRERERNFYYKYSNKYSHLIIFKVYVERIVYNPTLDSKFRIQHLFPSSHPLQSSQSSPPYFIIIFLREREREIFTTSTRTSSYSRFTLNESYTILSLIHISEPTRPY